MGMRNKGIKRECVKGKGMGVRGESYYGYRRLAGLYRRCGSLRNLAALLGMSPSTVRARLISHGIRLQRPGRKMGYRKRA